MEDRALSCLTALRGVLDIAERNDRALARSTGLTTAQQLVLRLVKYAHEVTPKTIAHRAGIAPASATALIEKLVRLEYLTRRRSETDRRKYWVSLTRAGLDALEAAPDPLHQRFLEAFIDIPDWEQAMILAGLERIASLLDDEAVSLPFNDDVNEISAALSFPAEPHQDTEEDPAQIEPTQADK